MANIKIENLSAIDIEIVHEAFVKAFSDYEVPMKISLSDFKEMFIVRDVDLNYSIGYFEDQVLVGFIICGYRTIDGQKCCYDAGTGIVKEFRRKGIANELLRSLMYLFREREINEFVLEVLENNVSAINLYKKNGFVIQRKLKCFDIDKEFISDQSSSKFSISNIRADYQDIDISRYLSFAPTWQNESRSIINNIDSYNYCSLSFENELIAFGFVHQKKGDIPQLGVLKEWRGKNLELIVINELKNQTEGKFLKFINIEDNNYLENILLEAGFSNYINQYEMKIILDK